MKYSSLFSVLFLLVLVSCDEIATEISDPNYSEDRVVLIEEFSGGNCNPCADAAVILEGQAAKHGDKLVIVTMHTLLGGPYFPAEGAAYNFSTQKGQDIIELLGIPLGPPAASVNRKLFEDEPALLFGRDKWSTRISDERAIKPKANLNIDLQFDAQTRNLEVKATIVPAENINTETRLSLLITESHIIDKQSTSNGIVDDWEHNHILRDYITAINGELLGAELTKGVPVVKNFNFTIPPEDGLWKAENLEVVAYIAELTEGSREILQAAAIPVIE